MSNIEDRVKEIVAAQFDLHPEQLQVDAPMAGEYGMDDLDQIEITMDVEDEFGIEIDDEEMTAFQTARNVIDYVIANVKA